MAASGSTSSIVTLSIGATYLLLLAFGLFMLAATYLFAWWQKSTSVENFLVAERRVHWFLGGSSIAASWIWAPAVFVSTLFAYQHGLAGLFWFTAPNMAALAIFALLAPRIREKMPYGYTLPQWILFKLQDEKVHKMYLYPFFFYQLMSITVQLYAGGNLLALLLGIPVYQATAVVTILGFLVALAVIYIPGFKLKQLWWVFNTVAACVMVPTMLSLYWEGLSPKGVFWGVLVAFFVGLPLFIYSNIFDKPVWIVGSALFVVGVTLAFCLALPKKVVVA